MVSKHHVQVMEVLRMAVNKCINVFAWPCITLYSLVSALKCTQNINVANALTWEKCLFAYCTNWWLASVFLLFSSSSYIRLFCLSLSGRTCRFIHKWTRSDAVYQHWWRFFLPEAVHLFHPRHCHLPPQGRGQAPGVLQGGTGEYHNAAETLKKLHVDSAFDWCYASKRLHRVLLSVQQSIQFQFSCTPAEHKPESNNLMSDLPYRNTARGQVFLSNRTLAKSYIPFGFW